MGSRVEWVKNRVKGREVLVNPERNLLSRPTRSSRIVSQFRRHGNAEGPAGGFHLMGGTSRHETTLCNGRISQFSPLFSASYSAGTCSIRSRTAIPRIRDLTIPRGTSEAARGSVPNQYVIKLKADVDYGLLERLHRQAGARIIREIPADQSADH